ncbi:5-deoxy-glucuronate isomerase [Thermus scotoductus]|uniref:5-deoxy-glucuronate isomerase n=1 Tax=Thermus scotoductus TaxID=37636 RepID=A0A430SGH6_THESC|nr:5-deoxy-glucuronate isomerase [Thermus scotoductus]RTH38625.1 5-deoxy-glucuronate isomerase [Thermus scotoductus]
MIGLSGGVEVLRRADPETVGWRYLHFLLVRVAGQAEGKAGGLELALVPVEGEAVVETPSGTYTLKRASVFRSLPHVLYLPPGTPFRLRTEGLPSLVAVGGAPAEGRYPERVFQPAEMRRELRGGGAALRQVNHILGPHLPAERLILYEVYTPSGRFSGWPPHRHDGLLGSAYMEETYLYRVEPKGAFALHVNYHEGGAAEVYLAKDLDLVLVPKGYHPVAAPPGANVYYLNYMAGELYGAERSTPPVDDPVWAWVKDDWEGNPLALPLEEA